MNHYRDALLARLASRDARIGVIGLGYVGLPLSLAFARAGLPVVGFDIDETKPRALLEGRTYLRHIPVEAIRRAVAAGRLTATTDFARARECDALIICVPTPLSEARDPDLAFVVATCESLVPSLRPGQLVVLESTTYPGTTDEVVRPILQRAGLAVPGDLFLAFSPEREDPGNATYGTRNIPKIVGADDADSLAVVEALYECAIERIVPVSSTRAAELTKLLENVFRSVNIALVNELKLLCERMGIDVFEVIDAAATKPFGYMPFYPGPGLGGHCIPIDPFYLTWKARQFEFSTRFIELAGEINTAMPGHVVRRLQDALNAAGKPLKGSHILVLGVAYKADVDDVRESPAVTIIELLEEKGAIVSYHDPHVPRLPPMRAHRIQQQSVPLTDEALARADCAVIVTNHAAVDYDRVVSCTPLVVDTRNATRHVKRGREKIVMA